LRECAGCQKTTLNRAFGPEEIFFKRNIDISHEDIYSPCMPFTFNGIGTSNYGARDFQPDGSYVTTEWFVFVYVPVIPFRSQRIVPNGKNKNYVVYASSGYSILEKTGINVTQVLSVYGWFAAVILPVWAAATLDLWWLAIPSVLVLFAPWLLRKRAIRSMVEQYKRTQMGLGTE
jgi:hypothetical protein